MAPRPRAGRMRRPRGAALAALAAAAAAGTRQLRPAFCGAGAAGVPGMLARRLRAVAVAPPPGSAAAARAGGAVGPAAGGRPLTGRAAAAGVARPALRSAQVFGVANALGFGISVATGSHAHLDLIGTGAFVAVAAATRGPDLRSNLSAAAVALWAARLTSFLFYRALQVGRDDRLERTLSTTSGAFGFWFISWLWGWLTVLPHALGAASAGPRPRLGLGAVAAGALYFFGLTWEVLGDFQKWWFKQDPLNKGKFCDVGLWSFSQHPNYFGNLCLWLGIFLLNVPVLHAQGAAAAAGGIADSSLAHRALAAAWAGRRVLLGAVGPLFLGALFFAQASGSLTNTVKLAAGKYGADPAYQDYLQRVPLIVPRLTDLLRGA